MAKRRNELFKRVKCSTLSELLKEEVYENNEEELKEEEEK